MEFYKVGETVESVKSDTGAWFSADIIEIINSPKVTGGCYFRILYEGDDESNTYDKTLAEIRQVSYESWSWNELKVGMKVVINYNIESPKKWGLWYDYIILSVTRSRTVTYLKGNLLKGYDGSLGKVSVAIDSDNVTDILKIRSHVKIAVKESADYATGTKPELCTRCRNKPKLKCRKCCCSKCGLKKDFDVTYLCGECYLWFHLYCLDTKVEVPSDEEDDWYCPKCKNHGPVKKKIKVVKKSKKTMPTGKRQYRRHVPKDRIKGGPIRNTKNEVPVPCTSHEVDLDGLSSRILDDSEEFQGVWREVRKAFPELQVVRLTLFYQSEFGQATDLEKKIAEDTMNAHLWAEALTSLPNGKNEFLEHVKRLFTCSICHDLMTEPITLDCKHSFCLKCFFQTLAVELYSCALCREPIIYTTHYGVNQKLNYVLKLLFCR